VVTVPTNNDSLSLSRARSLSPSLERECSPSVVMHDNTGRQRAALQ